MRNSKKTYVGKLKNFENSSSATSSSTRVTKKAVLKTAAEVETALKTKLVSERSMGNKENEPAPEKSPTTVTSNQQPKKRQAIPEEMIPTKKTKSVQSSLNSYFQRKSVWFFFVSLIFFLTWIFLSLKFVFSLSFVLTLELYLVPLPAVFHLAENSVGYQRPVFVCEYWAFEN